MFCVLVGASVANPDDLRYLYESHEDFTVLPSFYVLPGLKVLFESESTTTAVPGRTITLDKILHGEQYLELVGDMPLEGNLFSKSSVVEVLDKGSGAVVVTDST